MEEYLLIKYYLKELDSEETQMVFEWIKEKEENSIAYNHVVQIWNVSEGAAIFDELDSAKALRNIKAGQSNLFVRKANTKFIRIAAAVALLITTSILTMVFNPWKAEQTIISYAEGKAPKRVDLPDGSTIYMQAPSEIRFQEKFTGKERRIALAGNAFFEVAKDKSRPFIVSTENAEVRVLGTSFQVTDSEDRINVQVSTGKVQLISRIHPDIKTILLPGDEGVLHDGKISSIKIQNANHLAWKTGVFTFDDQDIDQVIQSLNSHYSKEIKIKSGFRPSCKLTAVFENEKQAVVLETIKFACDMELTDKGDYFEFSQLK